MMLCHASIAVAMNVQSKVTVAFFPGYDPSGSALSAGGGGNIVSKNKCAMGLGEMFL